MIEPQQTILIIIDQLRADYLKYLPKTAEVLKYNSICYTNSFPSSTEPMHANISTGKYPKQHGLISKISKTGRKDGIEEFLNTNNYTLSSIMLDAGYDLNILGGKDDVIKILARFPEDFSFGLILSQNKNNNLYINSFGRDLKFSEIVMKKHKEYEIYCNKPEKSLDSCILEIFNDIESLKTNKHLQFWILTLPMLDFIGHRYGPGSVEVIEHLNNLDSDIFRILSSRKEANKIVIGDHGCRKVKHYLIESDESNPRHIIYYENNGNDIRFKEEYFLDENIFNFIQYDGGILRMGIKTPILNKLEDFEFLSQFGCLIPYGTTGEDLDRDLRRMYLNSLHPNLSDYTVVANRDVMFCKFRWLTYDTQVKVSDYQTMQSWDFPIGEHGTHYNEDTEVLLMSNKNLGNKKKYNIEIIDLILNLPDKNIGEIDFF